MRLTELTHSTYFRFAALLAATFLVVSAIAGVLAFRVINVDLEERVIQSAEYSNQSFEDLYRSQGRVGLIAAVAAQSASAKPDDEILWLGTTQGERLAGSNLSAPLSLSPGEVRGEDIAAEVGDRYRVAVREIDGLRIITILNFDVAEAIVNTVLRVFALAGLFLVLMTVAAVLIFSLRARRRLGLLADTLHEVSRGNLGSRVALSGPGDDIDELAEQVNGALEQLENTVEGIRQVGANIAHDLRTPINRLGIQLEQMRDAGNDADDLTKRLDAATDEVRNISSTFDALLRISQIESGARKERFQPVSLTEVANTIHEAYAPVAEENHQDLRLSIATQDGARIHGDRGLLTQALANLTENALQHCPAGTTIYLEVGEGGRGVWASVSDDGPGVPASERMNVLKRSYRLDKSRTTAGSGLGLALVKAIGDLHDARLCLRDSDPGLSVRLEFQRLLHPEAQIRGNTSTATSPPPVAASAKSNTRETA